MIRNPFSFLFTRSRREQYLEQYVIRECARGRGLAEVLEDPYLRNRSTAEERSRLLDRPEVIAALGEQTISGLRASRLSSPG